MTSVLSRYLSSELRDELVARWSESHRRYHTLEHLRAVLAAVDDLEHSGMHFDRAAVELAAWFHDAIYDVGRGDNEERSAALAVEKLPDATMGHEVARLVRLTADHSVEHDDANAAVLCDADLAVLAGTADEYASYARRVREEYESVPDEVFAGGRATLLERMLTAESLFHTPYGRLRWEQAARVNVGAEIVELRGFGGM